MKTKSGKKSGHLRFNIAKREAVKKLQHGWGLRRWSWLFKCREKSCSDKEAFTLLKIGEMGLTAWDYDEAAVTE